MNETVWIRHAETGAVAEVPREALPIYRQSNWDTLTDDEVADRDQTAADETAAAEQAMRQQAEQALSALAPPQPSPPAPDNKDAREAQIMPEENG